MRNTSTRLNLEPMEVRDTPAVLTHPMPVPTAAQMVSIPNMSSVHLTLTLDDPRYNTSSPSAMSKSATRRAISSATKVRLSWSSGGFHPSRPLLVTNTDTRDRSGSRGFGLTSRQVTLERSGYVIAVLTLQGLPRTQTVGKAVRP
jgi:hypothetical protein